MLSRIIRVAAAVIFLSLFSGVSSAAEDDSLCAVVVIQIAQEVAFERQAFKATMEISNALEGIALEDVSIEVLFTDEYGNPSSSTYGTSDNGEHFFINVDNAEGLTGGSVTPGAPLPPGLSIEPSSVAKVEWLIIPTANATQNAPEGRLYFVGANLSYTYGGKQEQISVAPDSIVVKPLPKLELDYFLTQEVIGDDAFTPEIEPPIPYHLGLRVTNKEYGTAKNFTVESAQPEIVENEQGLAIGFTITGSFVNEEPAQKSLLVNLGDVQGMSVSTARWIMETSLSGKFIDISAEFSHAKELGGELTSVIDSVTAHLMVHDVLINLPGRDDHRDFLVEKAGSFYAYESEMTNSHQAVCSNCIPVSYHPDASLSPGNGSSGYFIRTLTASGITPSSAAYIKVSDSYGGTKDILSVRRADGSLLEGRNAWVSQERDEDVKSVFNYFVNVFDATPSESYVITFIDKVVPEQPPVFIPVNPVVVNEGQQVGFLVRADDPNGDTFSLTATRVPAGGSFQLDNPKQGVFLWNTPPGSAGTYQAVFEANDGLATSHLIVPITVVGETTQPDPDADSDQDGIPDVIETSWGLDPANASDAFGDMDGDGYTNLDEWLAGSDPSDASSTPVSVNRLLYSEYVPAGNTIRSGGMALRPQGDFAYVVEQNDLRIYRRDKVFGGLAAVGLITGQAMQHAVLTISPDGEYLYAVRSGYDLMHVFRLDSITGEPQLIQTVQHSAQHPFDAPASPVISANGQLLYIPLTNATSESGYLVFERNETGLLDFVQLFETNNGQGLGWGHSLALSDDGSTAFTFTNSTGAGIRAIALDPQTGMFGNILAYYSTSGFASGGSMMFDAATQTIIHQAGSTVVRTYAWDSTDGAEAISYIGQYPSAYFLTPSAVGNYLLSTNAGYKRIYNSRIEPDGSMTTFEQLVHNDQDSAGTVINMNYPNALSVTEDGRHVYVSNENAPGISVFYHDRFFDIDGDGVHDKQDPDIDGDGEANESDAFPYDSADSVDTDGDGFGDNTDAFPQDNTEFRDTDGDGIGDNLDTDDDGDGIPDAWEMQHGLDPRNADDALYDQDNDGLNNLEESSEGTDPHLADTDGDGGLDGDEVTKGTDPTIAEAGLDSDADGCLNSWEMQYGFGVYDNTSPDASLDQDSDGLNDYQECLNNSSPFVADTDGDGVSDLTEQQLGTAAHLHSASALFSEFIPSVNTIELGGMAIRPQGDFVYAVEQNDLRIYRRDKVFGGLTAAGLITGQPMQKAALTISPDGNYLYAVRGLYDMMYVFRLDNTTGEPQLVQTVQPNPQYPFDAPASPVISADGQFLYIPLVNASTQSGFLVLERNEAGLLDFVQLFETNNGQGLGWGHSLALSDDGTTAFTFTNSSGAGLRAILRDPQTGVLGNVLAYYSTSGFTSGGSLMFDAATQTILHQAGHTATRVYNWDSTDGSEAITYVGQYTSAYFLTPSATGDYLLSINGGYLYNSHIEPDGSLTLFETLVHNGQDSAGTTVNMRHTTALSVAQDGRHIYTSTKYTPGISVFYHDRFFDIDGDGIHDKLDPDIDGDGVANESDAFPYDSADSADTDGDGFGDNTDAFPQDNTEFRDTDGDGIGDNLDTDDDGDGIPDAWEMQHGLDPRNADDALYDQDNDGLNNLEESSEGTDPHLADTDGDGGLDGDEVTKGTDPTVAEASLDSDADGCLNSWEMQYGFGVYDSTSPDALLDQDSDGLNDYQECLNNSSPFVVDTDGDGVNDLVEIQQFTSPTIDHDSLLYGGYTTSSTSVVSPVVSSNGKFVYASSEGIQAYRRDLVTGALTLIQELPGIANAKLVLSPDNEYLYIGGGWPATGSLTTFRIDPATGEMQHVQTLTSSDLTNFGGNFGGVLRPTPSTDNQFLYVPTNGNSGHGLHVFRRHQDGWLERIQELLISPAAITLAGDNEEVLFAANGLTAYARDPLTGLVGDTLTSVNLGNISSATRIVYDSATLRVHVNAFYGYSWLWDESPTTESFTYLGKDNSISSLVDMIHSADNIRLYAARNNSEILVIKPDSAGILRIHSGLQSGVADQAGNIVEGLSGSPSLAASPDGRHVYAASAANRVVIFYHDRFFDIDGDGIHDKQDPDIDGDGVANESDAFPYDPNESVDTDGDGIGDNTDTFPQDNTEFRDTDGDGVGDNVDTDDDGDGIPDAWEMQHGLDPRNADDALYDQDNDGLNNLQEYQQGGDPHAA